MLNLVDDESVISICQNPISYFKKFYTIKEISKNNENQLLILKTIYEEKL